MDDVQVKAAAIAMANARGQRRGIPPIPHILERLPRTLREEVLEDARVALEAAETAHWEQRMNARAAGRVVITWPA